ncbi:MAG: HWE histidine kinase domain-containing protein [Pseudomonadota bacterium]
MTVDDAALAECDAEPIHIPGVIQQNGCLVGVDPKTFTVAYVSENATDYLGRAPADLLGTDAGDIFGSDLSHALRNVMQVPAASTRRVPVGRLEVGDRHLEVQAFLSDTCLVVELEPMTYTPWADAELSSQIAELFQLVNQQTTVDALLKTSVRWLEVLSGYDRVMVYRFKQDWSGEVVAERNNSGHEDFLNLCFPAWDIPTQAREIMMRLPMRMIVDARAEPVPIRAATEGLPPLDISIAHLRGVSPVHLQYLHNMGVQASMTLSIIVDGKLWGIISFHHYAPMIPSPRTRAVLQPFIEYFNVKLSQLTQIEAGAAREKARQILEDLRKHHGEGASLSDFITGDPMPLIKQFRAQGMAVRLSGNWQAFGRTMPAADIEPMLAEALESRSVYAVDHRMTEASLNPTWAEAKLAGTLVMALGGDDVAVVFREEIEGQIRWAGAPDKEIHHDGATYRLSPRGSFSLYVETVKHRSEPWRAIDIELAEGLASLFLQSEQQRQRVERQFYEDRDRQQRLMINELNHRVRNILALIRSVSRQARTSNASLESYSAALEHRIKALAVAHNLSNDTALANVNLVEIIGTELAPYADRDASRFTVSGPSKAIRPDLCPIFALVIHELSTNAAKYGALSAPEGRIEISFEEIGNGLQITWREIGGPPADATRENGFGTVLIENAIPFELDGRVDLSFAETGLITTLWLPDEVLSTGLPTKDQAIAQFPNKMTPTLPLATDLGTALLVEDNYAIALDSENMLREIGFSEVLIASNVERGLRFVERANVVFGVLDMHLGKETSFPVARTLMDQDIPMIFATGYGSDIRRPPDLEHISIVTKPVELDDLAQHVAHCLTTSEKKLA